MTHKRINPVITLSHCCTHMAAGKSNTTILEQIMWFMISPGYHHQMSLQVLATKGAKCQLGYCSPNPDPTLLLKQCSPRGLLIIPAPLCLIGNQWSCSLGLKREIECRPLCNCARPCTVIFWGQSRRRSDSCLSVWTMLPLFNSNLHSYWTMSLTTRGIRG